MLKNSIYFLDVPMYATMVLQNQVSLRFINTQLCTQGMEYVVVLWHHLVSFLT
jgi:hypothetical protein